MKRRQVQLLHRLQHEPGEVLLGQPIAQADRHQVLLLTLTRQVTLRHGPTPAPQSIVTLILGLPSPRQRFVRQPLLGPLFTVVSDSFEPAVTC